MRRCVIVATTLLATATLILAGCGGGSHQATLKSTPTDPSTTKPSTGKSHSGARPRTATTITPGDPKVPTKVPQNLTARHDVSATICSPAPGGYQMGGRIKNTLGKTATYKITAVFTDAAATDIGYGTTDVAVPAGVTKPWSVTAKFNTPSRVICVLRGVNA